MADMRGEPTMEEILASIRRIIAEDPAPATRAATTKKGGSRQPQTKTQALAEIPEAAEAENPSFTASIDTDVDMNESTRPMSDFEARLQAASADMDIPVMVDAARPVVAAAPAEPETAAMVAEEDEVLELTQIAHPAEGQGILSAATASVAAERLQQLSNLVVRPEAGSMTLEGLVREMLRPMLKEWLDANLPDIVDQVVSREIARITGQTH